MAPLAPRRYTPQVEAMREADGLRATASPHSIKSYDEKRRDYVERPTYGSHGWDKLATALSRLNPHLNKMAEVQNERFREEQTAIGRDLMHKNKVEWASFIQDNPDYAGLNPHLEQGYKAAELAAKSQDFNAALQNFYTTGGLANETDPTNVREAVNAFGKEWTSANVQPGTYEPGLYADNFLKHAEVSEGQILTRHVGDRADEHMRQAVEKHGQLFTKTIDSLLDTTPNIGNPDVFNATLDTIASNAMSHMQQMEATGLPRSKATAVIEDALINLAKAEGQEGNGEEILALANRIKTGSGTIGGKPDFRAKEKILRDAWDGDRRQRNSEHIQMWHFNKAKAEEGAVTVLGKALMDAYRGRQPMPDAATLMALPGVGPEHMDIANASRNNFLGLTAHRPVLDKSEQVSFAVDHHLARTGYVTPQQALDMVGRYGLEKGMDIYDTVAKTRGGSDPVSLALQSEGVHRALTLLEAQMTALGNTATEPETLKARIVEAREALLDQVEIYILEGEKKDSPRTKPEIRTYARELAAKMGAEPQYRDLDTVRNIQTPEEKRQISSPDYWRENTRTYFTTPEEAGDMFWSYVRSEAKTITELQTKHGIPPAMVNNFLANQALLYNIDLPGLIQRHQEEKTTLKEQEAQKNSAWELETVFETYPMY